MLGPVGRQYHRHPVSALCPQGGIGGAGEQRKAGYFTVFPYTCQCKNGLVGGRKPHLLAASLCACIPAPFHKGGGRDQAAKFAIAQIADPERAVGISNCGNSAGWIGCVWWWRYAPYSRDHARFCDPPARPGNELSATSNNRGELPGRSVAARPRVFTLPRAKMFGDGRRITVQTIEERHAVHL